MKQLILLFLLLVAVILTTAFLLKGGQIPTLGNLPRGTPDTIKIGDKTIKVEIADSPEEHEKGLSGRDSLPKDAGMLFVLPENSEPIFFMSGMKFSIDIIWIADNKIIGFSQNLEPPGPDTPQDQLPLYKAPAPVDYVLEVNANFVQENKITTDTKIELPKQPR